MIHKHDDSFICNNSAVHLLIFKSKKQLIQY